MFISCAEISTCRGSTINCQNGDCNVECRGGTSKCYNNATQSNGNFDLSLDSTIIAEIYKSKWIKFSHR